MKCLVILFSLLNFCFSQISIIANRSVQESSIDKNDLRDYYTLAKKRWSNSSRIICFDYKKKIETQKQFYEIINKQPIQLKKEWLRKKLTGEANPPQLLDSEDEMLRKISETEGAIGYINSSKVSSNVKVLATFD